MVTRWLYFFLVKRNTRGLETLKIPLFQLPFAPPWFQEQWFEHVRNEEQWDENKIMAYCSNVSRRWVCNFFDFDIGTVMPSFPSGLDAHSSTNPHKTPRMKEMVWSNKLYFEQQRRQRADVRYLQLAGDGNVRCQDIRYQILAVDQVTISAGQVTISDISHQILAAGQVTTESPEEILVVLAPYRWSSACKLGKHLLWFICPSIFFICNDS